ncbi:unnamed protein product [Thlaspi arvense]|uniref:Uncharacterized protein n=1 Tax=Thlaspi arvense TaxID=13288 RepID=A0AAU9SVE8_THLAR|nr:unnamed protein product [Thlaspi arvense]
MTSGDESMTDLQYSSVHSHHRYCRRATSSCVYMALSRNKDYFSKWGESGEVDLMDELERLIILTASKCLLGRQGRENAQANQRTIRSDPKSLACSLLLCLQDNTLALSLPHGPVVRCLSDEIQEYFSTALDEQKRQIEKHGDQTDHDIFFEMDVLFRYIKEVLRLHPPLIMFTRAQFSTGREEDKAVGAFSYISFGGGRHVCLYLQIKTIWSHLLRIFEHDLISPDWNAMVVGVKGNVMVRYKLRQLLSKLVGSVNMIIQMEI